MTTTAEKGGSFYLLLLCHKLRLSRRIFLGPRLPLEDEHMSVVFGNAATEYAADDRHIERRTSNTIVKYQVP
ncbi:hypothetical protein ANO14919_131750 [Xylariales sp. No.14919]|nr:hypothetical protein ANO14919_131750 [Xylariales sp. No.14919]